MEERPKFEIDKAWFVDRLARNGKSLRALARHLGVDASSMSRMLAGKRAMKMSEASDIAAFISSSVEEVLSHAGVSMSQISEQSVKIVATIDENGTLSKLRQQSLLPPNLAKNVAGLGGGREFVAATVRASKGVMSLWDDTVILYSPDSPTQDAAGSLCVVTTDAGKTILAHVLQVRKTLEATLRIANGDTIETTIKSASPVLAIIP